jgi:Ca2+-binding EF-hand superfamily protein
MDETRTFIKNTMG